MDESDYWKHLEFRVCHELAATPEKNLRFLWCDGFIAQQYLLADSLPRITGRAWIGNGRSQEQWEFTLYLNHPVDSRSQVEWHVLLPPEHTTH